LCYIPTCVLLCLVQAFVCVHVMMRVCVTMRRSSIGSWVETIYFELKLLLYVFLLSKVILGRLFNISIWESFEIFLYLCNQLLCVKFIFLIDIKHNSTGNLFKYKTYKFFFLDQEKKFFFPSKDDCFTTNMFGRLQNHYHIILTYVN